MKILADFHVHTELSGDSKARFSDIITKALERGLDMIAITDHFVSPEKEIFQIVKQNGRQLVIVKGQEVSVRGGFHLIALAISEAIRNFLPFDEALKEIHSRGGLAIIPHAFDFLGHGLGGKRLLRILSDTELRRLVDAVEGFNANGVFPLPLYNFRTRRIAEHLQFPRVAVSDAHQARHVGISATRFEGELDLSSAQNFRLSLRRMIRDSPREFMQKYVSYLDFFSWLVWPKLKLFLKGRPVKIQPPASAP